MSVFNTSATAYAAIRQRTASAWPSVRQSASDAVNRVATGIAAYQSGVFGVRQAWSAAQAFPNLPGTRYQIARTVGELGQLDRQLGRVGLGLDVAKLALATNRTEAGIEIGSQKIGEYIGAAAGAAVAGPVGAATGRFVVGEGLQPVGVGMYRGGLEYSNSYGDRMANLGPASSFNSQSIDNIRYGSELAFGRPADSWKDSVTNFAHGFGYTFLADATTLASGAASLGASTIEGLGGVANWAWNGATSGAKGVLNGLHAVGESVGPAVFNAYSSGIDAIGGYLGPNSSEGCGDAKTGWLVPDGLFGVDFRNACDAHDAGWSVGSTFGDRLVANGKLGLDIFDASAGKPWYTRTASAGAGVTYTGATTAAQFVKDATSLLDAMF